MAAKAAGYGDTWSLGKVAEEAVYVGPRYEPGQPIRYRVFMPLENYAHAFQLLADIREFLSDSEILECLNVPRSATSSGGEDRTSVHNAICRAIVLAAARVQLEREIMGTDTLIDRPGGPVVRG